MEDGEGRMESVLVEKGEWWTRSQFLVDRHFSGAALLEADLSSSRIAPYYSTISRCLQRSPRQRAINSIHYVKALRLGALGSNNSGTPRSKTVIHNTHGCNFVTVIHPQLPPTSTGGWRACISNIPVLLGRGKFRHDAGAI